MLASIFMQEQDKKSGTYYPPGDDMPGENPNRHPGPGGETEGSYFPEDLEPPFGEWDGWADNIDWGIAGSAIVIAAFLIMNRKKIEPLISNNY